MIASAPPAGAVPRATVAVPIGEVARADGERLRCGVDEFDRVVGGGLVPGTLALFGGDPGVGKSTLLLQVAGLLGRERTVLYVSGEESTPQLRIRALRLGAVEAGLLVAAETEVDAVEALSERHQPSLLIVDSIQTMVTRACPLAPGSPVQMREVAARLLTQAKNRQVPTMVVGHVTKAGMLAGPRLLEHMVDVVLLFEGERYSPYRLLRALKNRFGSTQELGVFQMGESGLEEVPSPSAALLAERAVGVPGAVVGVTMEGSRPLLCEVQALLAGPAFGTPRRTAAGVDGSRLALLLAVLEKRCALRCGQSDAYVKVAGGLRLEEPSTDLALALALASAFLDRPFPADTVAIGEVGLGGEVRGVQRLAERIAEAERLGFRRALVPPRPGGDVGGPSLDVLRVATLREALAGVLGAG